MSNPVVQDPTGFTLPEQHRRLIRWQVYIGFAAMFAGVTNGLAQALSYARINILNFYPKLHSYYQGLTMHGVANALIMTFAFGNAFLVLMTSRALSRRPVTWLLWGTLLTMLGGIALAGYAILTNQASVLYTAYAPLQAHWTFYTGLVLVVISTWLASANMYVMLARWRRDNPGKRVPLLAFISVVSWAMWDLASLGVAVSFLGFLIPWSIGLLPKVDPLLNRTLFWMTGHAIVYAWLLPAYVSWYALVPRQAGGKLISDPLTRFVFLLFLVLSIPVGLHHQYTDPGVSQTMKGVQGVLTFGVFFPSLITAFSVLAALEIGGRSRGGKGLLGWIPKLPWGDPSLSAQLLAMLTFVLGGITGLINSSYTINQVVHNTTWVPGHFHMTVGSAVALSFMGISYWLVPYLTGRGLWAPKLAVAQGWIYAIGVFVFARGMISGGLAGMPRRTFLAQALYDRPEWHLAGAITGVGGTLMFIGSMIFFLILVMTVLAGRRGEGPADIPFGETMITPPLGRLDSSLDKIGLWVGVAIALIILSYGPFFLTHLPPHLTSPGYRLW